MLPRILFMAAALCGTLAAAKPNILLICIDDLRPELKSFGAEYIHSPAMDSLAASGRPFHRHYVQAPTCGSSRYALMTGRYAVKSAMRGNDALFLEAGKGDNLPTLPGYFRKNGYRTVSVGKVTHHPGGLGGPDWNDPDKPELPGAWDVHVMPVGPWEHPRGAMHGTADGVQRVKGETPAIHHQEGDDMTYTDGWITREALSRMEELAAGDEPFFLAVGIMKPHLPFATPKKYRDIYDDADLPPIPHPEKPPEPSTWQASGEFMRNYNHDGRDPRENAEYADQSRRSYAACVSYADKQVEKLMGQLKKLGLEDDTIVVLWGDHGFHLGEHAVWGKHTLFEESLLAPLIVRVPGMATPGEPSRAVVETIDLFPTLCELAKLDPPDGLAGDSLAPELADPSSSGGEAVSYFGRAETIRTSDHRLIRQPRDGRTLYELYDHRTPEAETRNLAKDEPELVKELEARLDRKLN